MNSLFSRLALLAVLLVSFAATAQLATAQIPDIPAVAVTEQLEIAKPGSANFSADTTFTVTLEDGSQLKLTNTDVAADGKVTAFTCGEDSNGNARRYHWNKSQKKYHAWISEGWDTREFTFRKNGEGGYDTDITESGEKDLEGTTNQD